jgi:hypothetical protein
LSNTAEREQHKIPLQVEHWIGKVLEQLNQDTDCRNEENIKIHTKLVSWIVHLLLPQKEGVKETKKEQFEVIWKEVAILDLKK